MKNIRGFFLFVCLLLFFFFFFFLLLLFFFFKTIQFLEMRFSVYLNRRVFVMFQCLEKNVLRDSVVSLISIIFLQELYSRTKTCLYKYIENFTIQKTENF